MIKTLLSLLLLITLSTGSFAQGSEQFAFADRTNLINDNLLGNNPDEPNVVFYPNPVKTILNVKFPQKGIYTVKIFNIVGDKIAERTINDDTILRFNMSDFNNGMYFLTYEFNGHIYTKTFSKSN